LQDVEITIRDIQFGTGLVPGEAYDSLEQSHRGRSRELDALAAYMALLEVPPSPFSANQEAIQRGKSKFAVLGCQSCHTPPRYTNGQLHDVGTGDPNKEKNSHGRETDFDTPSLLGVWPTAPYLHDGSAATLEDVFQSGTVHDLRDKVTPEELEDLIAFLRSMPNRN
jgi:cytochrome c peroxidase